eukprot:5426919-Prymnesium_polylepis.1
MQKEISPIEKRVLSKITISANAARGARPMPIEAMAPGVDPSRARSTCAGTAQSSTMWSTAVGRRSNR